MTPPTPTQTPPVGASSKGSTFLHRLISTVLLWALILGALFSGVTWVSHSVFAGLIVLVGTLGLAEFYGLARRCNVPCFPGWGLFAGLLWLCVTFFALAGWPSEALELQRLAEWETALVALLILGLLVRQLWVRENGGMIAMAITLAGVLYVAWLLGFMAKIFLYPDINGTLYLVYFILLTKFSDTGAYAVGSLLGRHKMIPRISPGKTWEGFAGALLVPVLTSVVFVHLAGDRLMGMKTGHAVALGLLLGVGAVMGDLVESLFKRHSGVKDSGSWFPGIGGILDLIDSLLFNAPIMYWYLRFILAPDS